MLQVMKLKELGKQCLDIFLIWKIMSFNQEIRQEILEEPQKPSVAVIFRYCQITRKIHNFLSIFWRTAALSIMCVPCSCCRWMTWTPAEVMWGRGRRSPRATGSSHCPCPHCSRSHRRLGSTSSGSNCNSEGEDIKLEDHNM